MMFLNSIFLTIGVIVVAVLISWLMRVNFLTISDVTVLGADADITTDIHDVVMNELSGKYIGLFPHGNTLIYPKSEIISTIRAKFPRILNVDISRDGLTNLRISVNQKTPSALVCVTLPNFVNDQVVIEPSDPCYFADETGLLFEKNTDSTQHQYNTYFVPDMLANVSGNIANVSTSSDNYIGSYATSTSEFMALQNFYSSAQTASIRGDAILIKPNGEYEFYSSSTTIYFNNKETISDELSNLTAFWKHMLSTTASQKKPMVFDYIDLRYDSNVFYKVIK